ncbi:hypothetical protein COV94_01825, partial [Candidatus Woesearchaeota archaeon CG11_big_fil_rev_8_21_14_0_20_57_5]
MLAQQIALLPAWWQAKAFTSPWALGLYPLVVVLMILILARRPQEQIKRKLKGFILLWRLALLLVLCLAIAAPVAHETHEVQRQPYVHILVDNSSSMSIMDMTEVSAMVEQLRGAVEVRQDAIGGGTDSRIYTHLLRYLSADETIILVTDGNSYDGADMEQVAQYA